MSIDESKVAIRDLLEIGKQKGNLTNHEILDALAELDFAPAVIIISQRSVSVRDCDKILVLDDGDAVGIGTHEELYESCPVYREICDSQMGGAAI